MTFDINGGLFEQCVGGLLFVVGDEAEVFRFVIFASVDWSLDLNDVAELGKVFPDVVLGDVVLELSDVDFTLLRGGFFDGNFLAFDNVILTKDFVQSVHLLEDDEGEPPATTIELYNRCSRNVKAKKMKVK